MLKTNQINKFSITLNLNGLIWATTIFRTLTHLMYRFSFRLNFPEASKGSISTPFIALCKTMRVSGCEKCFISILSQIYCQQPHKIQLKIFAEVLYISSQELENTLNKYYQQIDGNAFYFANQIFIVIIIIDPLIHIIVITIFITIKVLFPILGAH